jgi:arsenate reductase
MAEAIVNANSKGTWFAFSAGTRPTGEVHPLTVKVLEEIGIQHEGYSKNVSEFMNKDFDLVVTVCDSAAEDCPLWLKPGRQIHIPFRDPAAFEGNPEETIGIFRQVRDEILDKIPHILNKFISEFQ